MRAEKTDKLIQIMAEAEWWDEEVRKLAIESTEELNELVRLASKQESMKAQFKMSDGISFSEEHEVEYYLVCPMCSNTVGMIDDDNKCDIYEKYCSQCGQAIELEYTSEDFEAWGIDGPAQ